MVSKDKLAWIDIYEKKLFFFNLSNKKLKHKKFNEFLGFLICHKNNFIIGLENKIIKLSLKNNKITNLIKFNLQRGLRTNDGFLDSFGNLWFGILDEKKKHRGGLFCKFKNKKKIVKIFDNINTPNGPVFVNDYEFFFNDTSRYTTYKCKIKNSKIIKKKFKVYSQKQKPDGMCYDIKKKKLWICFFGNSSLRSFNMKGRLLNTLKLKAKNLTKCVLDGYRENTMYITTAFKNLNKKTYNKKFDGFIYKINSKHI